MKFTFTFPLISTTHGKSSIGIFFLLKEKKCFTKVSLAISSSPIPSILDVAPVKYLFITDLSNSYNFKNLGSLVRLKSRNSHF